MQPTCPLGRQFQGSEQQIGTEQQEALSWLSRGLAVRGKEEEVSRKKKAEDAGRQVLEEPGEAELPSVDGEERGRSLQRGT